MLLQLPYGDRQYTVEIGDSGASVVIAQSKHPLTSATWESVVADALPAPIGTQRISEQHLRGSKVVIITDDWGRPTPAFCVVPLLLDELALAGVADEDITFVTAGGMHDPMSHEDLARKLGADAVRKYRCISHDAGNWEMLRFVGLSPLGTPVWINRYVVEADYRVGLGRVYPHVTHGYEGGHKLILPGVSGFDTILRDHSFNFSEDSIPGIHENPSRAETDSVGRMVAMDFLINVVVNGRSEPIKAFAGAVEPVHQRAIEYGDREVWGSETGQLADIVIGSHGSSTPSASGFDAETLRRACLVAKPEATVIMLSEQPVSALPDWRDGEMADDTFLDKVTREAFGQYLRPLAFGELMRLHERRDWPLSPREIQWRVKALRGEFYRRRWLMTVGQRNVVFTSDPQKALDDALAACKRRAHVVVLPEGNTTFPKVQLYSAP